MTHKFLLLLVVVLLFVTNCVDGELIKEKKRSSKTSKKKKTNKKNTKKDAKKLNAKKFQSSMKRAERKLKEKGFERCSEIIKAARVGDMDFLKPGGGNMDAKARRKLKVNCVDEQGYSPLHHASRKGKLEFLSALIELGAKTEVELDHSGWTPLEEAAYWGQLEIVKFLLKAGANPNHMTKSGQNSLHVASQGRYGNEGKIVKMLVEEGAQIDLPDVTERTPLFDAAENGCLKCVKVLINAGAITVHRDVKGKTAIGHAARLGFTELVALLNKYERGPSDDEGFDHTPDLIEEEMDIIEEVEEKEAIDDVIEL